ncbi:MAG TPA: hypothetical protein VM124_03225 [Candidatus Limnocylindrales bacterium]|nr:hypothetical protein [Candidatus Limnocylindrales bacterium]
MAQSVIILGRQPALGIAELESLYGADKLAILGQQAVLLDIDPAEVTFNRLGGSVKLARLLTTLDVTDWAAVQAWLRQTVPEHLQYLPEGKLQLGISVYGLDVSVSRLNASGLELKKVIRAAGRSVRLIPNKAPALNSAQVIHNNLTGPLGWELLFVRAGSRTYVAQTVQEQDIDAYAARDQARPKRDARVGMLPPKLAQIIINLALGNTAPVSLLDPFCGTGVLLQEALLMGYDVCGSDIDPRMAEFSQKNLNWLFKAYLSKQPPSPNGLLPATISFLEIADATQHTWSMCNTIAAETYLGRPFSAEPKSEVLQEVIQDVNTIHRKFLQNVTRQTKPGFRMCIAVPAWKTTTGFRHLPVLDQLTDLGYNRLSFVHASNRELIYHRPEQIVARELVVLQRN